MTDWIRSHWPYLAPVLLVFLASLATALTRYPRAAGVVTALRVALDVLSVLVHRDSPGRWQWPLVERSPAPADLLDVSEALDRAGHATPPERPAIKLVQGGPLVALVLALAAAPVHAMPLATEPAPEPVTGWWGIAIAIAVAVIGIVLVFTSRRGPLVLGLCLALGASACASWRNDAGGYDPIGAAGRERLAARVDCLGPVVLEASGRVALGALQLVLVGQQTSPAAWRELLGPVVRGLEPRVLACLRAPAVAVHVQTDPPAIVVERAP